MKKLLLYVLLFGIFGALFYSYIQFGQYQKQNKDNTKITVLNFKNIDKYLKQNYKGHYPFPQGDLILLDNHNSMIHLVDRKTPLKDIKNLAIIQGTTCDILKDDKTFKNINYDKRFSIIDKQGNIIHKKCFSYAVTKDRTKFQIGTIIKNNLNYKAYLLGNSKKPIIKSYNTPVLVKDDSEDFLPYPADKLSPVVILKNKQNSSIKVNVVPFDEKVYTIDLKEGNNIILSGNSSSYDIEIVGNLSNNARLKFIDTNGSIVYINSQENSSKVDFKVKDYSIDTKKINYFVETGRFLANIVKLGDDKNMEVKKNGVTLVIRGTRFTIDAGKDTFNTFLSLGHILQAINGKTIDLTLQNAFSMIKNNKIFQDVEKIKELASFTVFNDIKVNPKYAFSMDTYSSYTGIFQGFSNFDSYKINYKNGQNIGLVVLNNPSHFLDYMKKNKKYLNIKGPIKRDIDYYKNIVNQMCYINKLGEGLDITKLYYTLDDKTNKLDGFYLKESIKRKLGLTKNNYLLFTSRKYNGQYSDRLVYNSQTHTIDSYNFARLSTDNDIEKIIFACDMK